MKGKSNPEDDLLMEEMSDSDMPDLVEEGATTSTEPTTAKPETEDPEAFHLPKTRRKRKAEADTPMDVLSSIARKPKKAKANGVRQVRVPNNRYTPLKQSWLKIFTPIVENLHLQVRFNLKSRCVEIRKGEGEEVEEGSIQKAEDFVRAFILGFSAEDALALVRLDDLFLESFEVGDVKPLKGEHLSRAIGRLAGKDGRTKFTIENITKTRIVIADSKIHILGSFRNIAIARNAVCALIMGSPPSKVYGNLRSYAGRIMEKM